MISCAAGRCLNFVTFFLKTAKNLTTGYWNRQSEKEITHCLYENAHITFMAIFKVERSDHHGEMRRDQLNLAVWECPFLPSEVGAPPCSNNGDHSHLPGSQCPHLSTWV